MGSQFGTFYPSSRPVRRSWSWLFWSLILGGLVTFLHFRWGVLPPLGPLLSPFEGALQTTLIPFQNPGKLTINGKGGQIFIELDQDLVPHIQAQNIEDAIMGQGYITALHRLWQIDFQNRAAAGRLSELVGEKAIEFDRFQRRFGIKEAARRSGEEMMKDEQTRSILLAYTEGINLAIKTWPKRQLPLEFKLLDYEPEQWVPENSGLLLKRMAFTLAGGSDDKAMSLILEKFGKSVVDQLFPHHLYGEEPIIPRKTAWNFSPLPIPPVPLSLGWTDTTDDAIPQPKEKLKDDEGIGSNNWAIAGKKTRSGFPILANDPHLSMKLPSTWYLAEIKAPGYHCMGASIPGAPGIISGFNKTFAWGVTNGYPDVCDWYKVVFKDKDRKQYWFDGNWVPTRLQVETIKIRGGNYLKDSIYWTHLGPVVYVKGQKPFQPNVPVGHALRWVAHDPSNELLAFFRLNQNINVAGMAQALETYACPAQNFVGADNEGNIAMFAQQGKLPLRWMDQGKFLMQAGIKDHTWPQYLPLDHLPRCINPPQGFLSSANQIPADSTYPYYLNWNYEALERGKRINEFLAENNDLDVEKVRQLQNDNLNLWARKSLPVFLEKMAGTSTHHRWALDVLSKWNFRNDAGEVGPTLFDAWWEQWMELCWADNFSNEMRYPNRSRTLQIMLEKDNSDWFDLPKTKELETGTQLVRMAFNQSMDSLVKKWGAYFQNKDSYVWGNVKATNVEHLAKISGLGSKTLFSGGGKGIVNATSTTVGQSWKMIVALGKVPEGLCIYPGGQSGNPASPYYDNWLEPWRKGQMKPLKMKW